VLATAKEFCVAVAYLHSMDVVHGDLKSSNVLLKAAAVTAGDTRGFSAKVRAAAEAAGRAQQMWMGTSPVARQSTLPDAGHPLGASERRGWSSVELHPADELQPYVCCTVEVVLRGESPWRPGCLVLEHT